MREAGLPATPAEFADAIRHLAPGIADAISPAPHARPATPNPPGVTRRTRSADPPTLWRS